MSVHDAPGRLSHAPRARDAGAALPAIPLGWGRLGWAGAVGIVLLIVALVSIWRARGYSRSARIVWTVVAVVLPIVGPLAWLVAGREPASRRRDG